MMVTINDFNNYNHQWVVDDFEGAYAFYSDEPHQNYYSFYGMRSYINSNSPGSFFITGDYKPTTGFQSYVDEVDKVMFTAYFRWYEILPDVWTDYYHANPDQRWNWEYYKNKYGSKSKSNWIAAHRDAAEFSDLLGKAQNLGLNEIWFYQNQNNMESVIQQYCLNAWVKGFLKRYVQKVTRYYTCIEHDCEICSEGGTWILYNTIYGNIQEDIY